MDVGEKAKLTVWAAVDKPYGPSPAPVEFSSIVWPDYEGFQVCPTTAAATVNVS